MAEDLIGRKLGRYEITALIGRGGMATVYRSTHPGLRQTVAVKVLHAHLADDPSLLVRFENEAQAVAALRHPNIVRVIDFDHIDEQYFMVMEYVEGLTLSAHLGALAVGGRRMPAAEVLRIFEPLCAAVDYAHRQGMVHRDVKPANVLLTAQGEPVLTDYGIARIVGVAQHTATGTVMGSAHYMSPEQAQGLAADGRSDIYSLGVMLFEALAGRVPYEADSLPAVLLKHLTAPVPAVCPLNPALPAPLDDLLRTALAKDPDERFQTGQALAAALREELGPLAAESGAAAATATTLLRSPREAAAGEPAVAPATAPPLGPTRVEAPLSPAPPLDAPPPAATVVTPRRPAADTAPANKAEPPRQAPQLAPATEQPVPAPVPAARPHEPDSPLVAELSPSPPPPVESGPAEDMQPASSSRSEPTTEASEAAATSAQATSARVMTVATFRAGTAYADRTIVHEHGAFVLEGEGALTAAEVMEFDRGGQLMWAVDGTRAWVGSRAAAARADPRIRRLLDKAWRQYEKGKYKAAVETLWYLDAAVRQGPAAARGIMELASEIGTHVEGSLGEECADLVARSREVLDSALQLVRARQQRAASWSWPAK